MISNILLDKNFNEFWELPVPVAQENMFLKSWWNDYQ